MKHRPPIAILNIGKQLQLWAIPPEPYFEGFRFMSGANLPGQFDPGQFQPIMGGGQSLPVSDKKGHLVVITESSFEQTSSGTGNKLVLTCHIQDGPHAGQEGNWNLNLGHPNATTVRIAQQELACVCHAVGHISPLVNTEVLHNKPFRIVVALQKVKPGDEDKGYTEVTKVLRADGSKLTDPPGSGGAAPSPAGPPPAGPPAAAQGGFPTTTQVAPPPSPAQQQFPPPQQAAPPQQQPWGPPQGQPQQAAPPWGAPPQQ